MPEAIETAIGIESWLDAHPEQTLTPYGHGIGMLGQAILNGENTPIEEQIAELRENARLLIQKYGDHIIEFMNPELRKTLGLDEQQK
ncbi:MAG: hypothetical protein UU03_C0002G0010 [Candidatus Woesebacteria bacterium GW2011_GWA1_40_45]|nr:MAG: hypothetical protein UT72_C0009G0010 [Candidatus Woesebacteria bacterium GW2011_GWB1_40_101]KKR63574.1 MAG: hypothetical protein UU03_C0002G0010 [Candidatus Woesebacteria bacterium GW2011_GWA1_40_45]